MWQNIYDRLLRWSTIGVFRKVIGPIPLKCKGYMIYLSPFLLKFTLKTSFHLTLWGLHCSFEAESFKKHLLVVHMFVFNGEKWRGFGSLET